MSDMTIEQKRALAVAKARLRLNPQKDEFYGKDVSAARTVLDQGLQGATFGFADEITDRIGAGIASLFTDQSYGDLLKTARSATNELQDKQFDQHTGLSIGANIAGGLLTGGAGATTKAGAALTNSLRTGNAGARIGKGMLAGSVSGGAYGAGSAEEGNRLKGAGVGALLGGVTGGAIPAAGAANRGVGNLLTPAIDDAKKSIIPLAKKYNIPLGLDDLTDSNFYKTVISEGENLPFANAQAKIGDQIKAFNKALAKTIGADDLTNEGYEKALKKIGNEFDDVLGGTTLRVTKEYKSALDDIVMDAQDTLTADTARIVERQYNNAIKDTFTEGGVIRGEKMASLRSKLSKIVSRTRNDATPLLQDMISVIDEEILRNAPEEVAERLTKARYQYKNAMALEPLVAKAQDGQISPAILKNRVIQTYGARNVAKGKAGELGDLVKIADVIKQQVPNSGTSQRTLAKNVLTGNAIGIAPTLYFGGPMAAAGQVGLTGAGLLGNRALQSRNYNPRILEKALNKKTPIPSRNMMGLLSGNVGTLPTR